MAQRKQTAPDGVRRGQEGSRWYNERPSGTDVAKWFKENVPLHDGLDADHYVTGITLIPAKEKSNEVIGYRDNGSPVIEERLNLVFVPYPRVDTRIKYFHDLMAAHPEWYGVIEPVQVETSRNVHLPPGYSVFQTKTNDGVVSFVVCTMKVTIWEREGFKETYDRVMGRGDMVHPAQVRREGVRVVDAPPASKMVATLDRYGADKFAMMKAETGAIGRALGMAGMLVVPGAGVATAEDMGEVDGMPPVAAEETPAQSGEQAAAPEGSEPTEDELRERARAIFKLLQENDPEKLAEFQAWAKERELGQLDEVTGPTLKGVVRQLERKLEEATE
jgi:hypothetical protein